MACVANGFVTGRIYTYGTTHADLYTIAQGQSGERPSAQQVPALPVMIGHHTCTTSNLDNHENLFQCPNSRDYPQNSPLRGCSHHLDQGVICYENAKVIAAQQVNPTVPCHGDNCPQPPEKLAECHGAAEETDKQPIVFGCVDFWTTSCTAANANIKDYAGALRRFATCAEAAPGSTNYVQPADSFAAQTSSKWNAKTGYCHATLQSGKYLSNQVICQGGSNVAIGFHIRVSFMVNNGGPYSFRIHADYGLGSYMG
jgi:hypothetical protein